MITVIGNLKGGCGKSTITFNLAVWLVRNGIETIACDLDPQATLSDVTEVRLEENIQPAIRVMRPDADPGQIFKQSSSTQILVDVGAANLWAMRQALSVADRVLIPVPPSQADVWSTQRFLNIVMEAVAGKKPPEILMFVNRADTHPGLRETDETIEALRSLGGVEVLDLRICQRTSYRRSLSEGKAVFEQAADSKAADEFLRLAYRLYPQILNNEPAKKKK